MATLYKATILRRDGVKQALEFALFNEAILWLRRELEEGDGLQGEVHLRSELLWRREAGPRVSPSEEASGS
jgi:hypothetical protein